MKGEGKVVSTSISFGRFRLKRRRGGGRISLCEGTGCQRSMRPRVRQGLDSVHYKSHLSASDNMRTGAIAGNVVHWCPATLAIVGGATDSLRRQDNLARPCAPFIRSQADQRQAVLLRWDERHSLTIGAVRRPGSEQRRDDGSNRALCNGEMHSQINNQCHYCRSSRINHTTHELPPPCTPQHHLHPILPLHTPSAL